MYKNDILQIWMFHAILKNFKQIRRTDFFDPALF